MEEAKLIYQANNGTEALKCFRKWQKRWQVRAPKAVECLAQDIEELLAFFTCPKEHWRRIRTTNVIERLFVEVRRRIRKMCAFTTRTSCERILYAVFNAAMGGTATYKQVFTVVVHAGPIGLLSQLFTVPLNYFRGTMTSSTNLGVFLPMLPEQSFAARLLSMIDLFLIWQLVVLSIGLAVLYRRRTQPIATALLILYALIALVIAFVRGGTGA